MRVALLFTAQQRIVAAVAPVALAGRGSVALIAFFNAPAAPVAPVAPVAHVAVGLLRRDGVLGCGAPLLLVHSMFVRCECVCVCVCVCVCARARVCACVCVCVHRGGEGGSGVVALVDQEPDAGLQGRPLRLL